MYRAEDRGVGRFERFDEVMREDAAERLSLENDLSRALKTGEELIVHVSHVAEGSHADDRYNPFCARPTHLT